MFSAPVAALVAQNGLPHRSEERRARAAAAPAHQRRERRRAAIDGARHFRVGACQSGALARPVAGIMNVLPWDDSIFREFKYGLKQNRMLKIVGMDNGKTAAF